MYSQNIHFPLLRDCSVTITLWICEGDERILHIESLAIDSWNGPHIEYTHISGAALDGLVKALEKRENWKEVLGDDAAYYNMQQNENGSCTFYLADMFESEIHELILTEEQQDELLAFITQQDPKIKIRDLILGNLPETVLLMNFREGIPLSEDAEMWIETSVEVARTMNLRGTSAEEAAGLIVTMMKLSRALIS